MTASHSQQKSSSDARSTTITEDNRVVATDEAIALGKGASFYQTFDKNVADLTLAILDGGVDFARETNKEALDAVERNTNKIVQTQAQANQDTLASLQTGGFSTVLQNALIAVIAIGGFFILGQVIKPKRGG